MAKKNTRKQKRTTRRSVPVRKQPRLKVKASKQHPVRSGDARRVEASLKRLRQAYRVANARAEDVLAVAHSLGEVAVQKHTHSLIHDLCEKQFLRDLIALRDALADVPTGSLPPRLETLRLLPDALIQWLEERFGLSPSGRAGEELEMPVSKLANYACEFDLPDDTKMLVRVRVVAPGWKCGNAPLIPARVQLAQKDHSRIEEKIQ